MKFGRLNELGARIETRFPFLWTGRRYLAVFIPLFLIFFAINHVMLKIPETLNRALSASPLTHLAYSDVTVLLFPPRLEIMNATLVDPNQHEVVVRFDSLTVRPELLQLITGSAALHITALAGEGSATLDVASDSFAFSSIVFDLNLEKMPLNLMESLALFDPDVNGTVTATISGKTGPDLSRSFDLNAKGRVTLASLRNTMAELTLDRFRNGMANFDLTVTGRDAVVRMDFTEQACSATLSGKMQLDWNDLDASKLDLKLDLKTTPEHVQPALLIHPRMRYRMEQGQPLPFTLQGPLGKAQLTPVI